MRDPGGSLTSPWVITDERRDAKLSGNAVQANRPPGLGRQLPSRGGSQGGRIGLWASA